jgi:excinuclease ABC subunit A
MTLSGGESQRIKLARELARPSTARTLYVLDEPTTGLHLHDLNQLIDVLQELVAKRSTVLVIEHNMELVKTADWVIDLGDGALLGEGSPEDLAKQNTPTGEALRETLTLKGSTKGQAPLPSSPPPSSLIIKGAKQNNLKNLSLSIPYNSLTVFTGPSGSGKSSLAFDTLFAEGQRRFAETLPSYARAYLKELPKPDAEEILGLPPVLAVEQKRGSLSSRSTVATMTNISNSLRILYSELGNAYHPETGDEILRISKEEAVERILSLPRGEKIQFLIPLQQPRNFDELLEKLNREGFLRIRMNGCYYQLDEKIPRERVRELYLVVDRLIVEPASRERLLSSIDRAPDGIFVIAGKKKDLFFNLSFTLSPDLFSFNSETGLCPECRGLGIIYGAHLEESDLSPLALFKLLVQKKETAESLDLFKALFAENNIDPTAPISSLSPDARDFVLKGASASYSQNNLSYRWVGLHPVLERLAHSKDLRSAIRPLLREKRCEACCGERLNPLARNVRLKGLTFPELCKKNLRELFLFFRKVPPCELAAEIQKQLKLLLDLGLHYLSLDRTAPTLSGGELQRIRLAGQLGSGLTSCLYIIDEPTLGLHPRDSKNLLVALKHLRDLGNTLILVEHEPLIIREANHLVEFGPRAGKEGGQIIAQGTIAQILKSKSSLTGAYLSGKKKIALPKKRRPYSPDVRVDNASLHNLKKISVAFPKGAITCLTGVSGAGKSSLMQVVKNSCGPTFEHVISVDQTPIGQTARADVASYSGVQTLLRTFFASLGASRTKGLEPRNFSPNHTKGMCRTCSGLGYRSVDLQFLPAVRIECEACNGYRLGPAALEIRYKGKHLGQILRLTIAEAHEYFSVIPRIARHLQLLIDAGLSYLQLGQELATLSGGEAQRLRLSAELAKREIGDTLYLIDEPTVGLHTDDVRLLLPIFHRLADHGNTLLIIEHHLDVIANADYVIDLGPEGGDGGGEVVATGTPEEIVMASRSHTGQFLKEMLKKRKEQRD